MKKALLVVPALLTIAGLAACSSVTSTLDTVLEKKTIVVGTEAGYAPFEYYDSTSGAIAGFDVEVVELVVDQIGEKHNVEISVEWQDMNFDSLLLAVNANQVDLVAAAMTITDERAEQVVFSNGYYDTQTVVVTLASNTTITSMDTLKTAICGAQLGTVQADYIGADGWNSLNSQHLLADVSDLVLQLSTGAIDALVVEDAVATALIANYTALSLKTVTGIDFDDAASYGLAASKDAGSSLISEINEALANIGEEKLAEVYMECLEASAGAAA